MTFRLKHRNKIDISIRSHIDRYLRKYTYENFLKRARERDKKPHF